MTTIQTMATRDNFFDLLFGLFGMLLVLGVNPGSGAPDAAPTVLRAIRRKAKDVQAEGFMVGKSSGQRGLGGEEAVPSSGLYSER